MAHHEQRVFIERVLNKFPEFFSNRKVLEVGSLNINGTLRDFFRDCDFTGIDVGAGRGVDVVCQGQYYDAPSASFDAVCSAECFEHNPYWITTVENMIRLCKPEGLMFFTCATDGRAEHGTSRSDPNASPLTTVIGWEYYRNLNENDFVSEIDFDKYFSEYYFEVNKASKDIYFVGVRNSTESEYNPLARQSPIPVIGVGIVNGVHWLDRLIESVDYPVDNFVIFNNNGRGQITEELDQLVKKPHNYIKKISVCHMPSNIGCSGAWNLTIKSFINAPYWIISNNDVAFTSGFLESMVNAAKDPEVGMVHCIEGDNGLGSFELFLIKDWVVQEYGLFDENTYPAYCEDVDYLMRIHNKPFKRIFSVNVPFLHGDNGYESSGSQTWRIEPSLKDKIDYSRILNEREYILSKWGTTWCTGIDPHPTPFNKTDLPLSHTTYDLNFNRKKYLGF
ncbi:Glycosyltransferase 2-like [uncultured Caudovirales phage]|uniref:Glycosyltransferase 2-like n=1 Tax=uncultured Caudovirales phage TaxID=2100421 RepID=A0A6J5KWC0_9CAUD|nr:Glycosyltransferase 2-like [uncultured Caudovirales phage]